MGGDSREALIKGKPVAHTSKIGIKAQTSADQVAVSSLAERSVRVNQAGLLRERKYTDSRHLALKPRADELHVVFLGRLHRVDEQ